MRRVFKTRTFARWSRKAGVSDTALCRAVEQLAAGLVDADLGGHVYKQRVPMPGRGKRGGARVIVGSRLGASWFLLFGFEKNERASIDAQEFAAFQRIAAVLLAMDAVALDRALAVGELTEICDEEEPNSH
ncbi:MAG: type II toxin-antitoxin system RelE/ParE family toxin [Proteobacteria bacterium]|nr:type II toxin-antitoxin system RelE/ParE family toxin [Pseudomonadota bacterium]